MSREVDATGDATAGSDDDKTSAKKLRANAEEFYPSTGVSLNHIPSPQDVTGSSTSATEKLVAPPSSKTERGGSLAQVHPSSALHPHPQLLKGAWIPSEQLRSQVKSRERGVQSAEQPSSLLDPATTQLAGAAIATAEPLDRVVGRKRSSEMLGTNGIPLSTSQTTTLSGYSVDAPLKSDDSGILVQGRKYPLASSDIQSETFSDAESFGSAEDISSRQLTVHEESNIAQSLLLANTEGKTPGPGIISKAAIAAKMTGSDSEGGLISASMSAPTLGISKLQRTPPPQASMSMSSRGDVDSPLLRLDSFKNRVKVTIQLPRDSVGRFIGKQGRNIKTLMSDSNTHVYVNQKNLPKEAVSVPCHIQGSANEVELALKQISIKFPEIDIPGSIDDISTVSATPLSSLSPLFANLEEGINWEVQLRQLPLQENTPFYAMVSYIESLSRLWVFPYDSSRKLDDLHQNMSFFYAYASSMGIQRAKEGDGGMVGRFCAAKVSDIHWLRAHVTKIGDDSRSYELQLVDYGSTVVLPPNSIRPLK